MIKILYAIQGTGNGHISRARDILPLLQQIGATDTLISGCQADVDPGFKVNLTRKGMSFIFGKKGGIDFWKTLKQVKFAYLWKEIKELPVEDYDLVINDFEPVSAWACKIKGVPCIALSHQWAVKSSQAPKTQKSSWIGKFILQHYAPCDQGLGFHFQSYAPDIYLPVIRKQVRELLPEKKDHYLVYLPAYSDKKIIEHLGKVDQVKWQIFSKHSKKAYSLGRFCVEPINNDSFLESLRTCSGIICGAGFELPAEAIYLKKKIMVIPMKGQYEQQCNAAALEKLGYTVVSSLKSITGDILSAWIHEDSPKFLDYPNQEFEIKQRIIQLYVEMENLDLKFQDLSLGLN